MPAPLPEGSGAGNLSNHHTAMQYLSVLYYKSSKHDNNHKEEFILEVGDNLLEAFVGLGQLAGKRLVLEGVGLLDEDLGHGGVQHQPLLNTSFELARGDDDVSEEEDEKAHLLVALEAGESLVLGSFFRPAHKVWVQIEDGFSSFLLTWQGLRERS